MDAEQALYSFLDNALINKKERYLGFISKPKTRNKFLNSIYHELEDCLDTSKIVQPFSEKVLSMTGYKFEPTNNFGEPISALNVVCNNFDESFLVVTTNGKYAIYGPEVNIDSRAFYAV